MSLEVSIVFQHSMVEYVQWRGQWDAYERPVVVLLLRVHLFTVVLAQVVLSQTLVHLGKNLALGALLRADETDHEALLNAEAEHALDVRTDDLEVHQTNDAVLEQVLAYLIDMQALVLELLFESDELTSLSLPALPVIFEWLGNDVILAASLDDIVQLRGVHQSVPNGVAFAIIDPSLSQNGHDGSRHALFS